MFKEFLRPREQQMPRSACMCTLSDQSIWVATSESYLQTSLLQKHAYSNILKISPPKIEGVQIKKNDIFFISSQNIYVFEQK